MIKIRHFFLAVIFFFFNFFVFCTITLINPSGKKKLFVLDGKDYTEHEKGQSSSCHQGNIEINSQFWGHVCFYFRAAFSNIEMPCWAICFIATTKMLNKDNLVRKDSSLLTVPGPIVYHGREAL